jgi:hypothetical protein
MKYNLCSSAMSHDLSSVHEGIVQVDIVRSALHVLRCVLRQDSAARQKLLERFVSTL